MALSENRVPLNPLIYDHFAIFCLYSDQNWSFWDSPFSDTSNITFLLLILIYDLIINTYICRYSHNMVGFPLKSLWTNIEPWGLQMRTWRSPSLSVVLRRDKLSEELQDLQRGAETLRQFWRLNLPNIMNTTIFNRKIHTHPWFPINFPLAPSIEALFLFTHSFERRRKTDIIAVFPLFS